VRGQPAQVAFHGGAGDRLAAGVVEDVEGEDFGGATRIEHADQCAPPSAPFGTYLARPWASASKIASELHKHRCAILGLKKLTRFAMHRRPRRTTAP
jgi:hypothetical protein